MSSNTPLAPHAFLDLWQDTVFLGEDFLTWLWIKSEINACLFNVKPHGAIELWFETKLHLKSGEGCGKRSVTCQTPGDEWDEAYTALSVGKKLIGGRLKLRTEDKEWAFNLRAETLTPQSVKFPKTFTDAEEEAEASPAGRLLERAALLQELLAILTGLFEQFLALRLSSKWPDEELPKLAKWAAAHK